MLKWESFSVLASIFLTISACAHRLPPPGKPEIEGPEIKILNLNELAEVSDTLRLHVEATDSSGVKFVRVGIDGKLLAADSTAPYEFILDVSSLSDTLHTLEVSATDSWDNRSSLKLRIIKKSNKESSENADSLKTKTRDGKEQ